MNKLQTRMILTEEEYQERAIEKASAELIKLIPMHFESYAVLKQYLNYLYTIGFYRGRQRGNKGREKAVQQIYKGVLINEFKSITEASRAVGISIEAIRKVVIGENNTAGGFYWRYKR